LTRGFSLIEIVVAAALLALVGATLMQTLNSSITVKERVDSISTRYHLVRQALSRMSHEISMAYISTQVNPEYAVTITAFKGEKDRLSFDAFGGVVRVQNAKESDQREISYFLERDKKTDRMSLMRREHPNITRDIGKSGVTEVLCPDVTKITFKYWNEKAKNWDSNWSVTALSELPTLPTRVQIELVAKMQNEHEQKFVTETMVWLTEPVVIN
jgi:general secretion pathway protein J